MAVTLSLPVKPCYLFTTWSLPLEPHPDHLFHRWSFLSPYSIRTHAHKDSPTTPYPVLTDKSQFWYLTWSSERGDVSTCGPYLVLT